jgi:hypothetical protein
MATMIPENVETFKTEGEKRFYRFLDSVAKPDNSYLVWYTPDIRGKEPDFILYSDRVGLIIFEVKDWAVDQILEADPHHFVLQMGNKKDSRKNPIQQVGDYKGDVMDKIKTDGRLLSTDPAHHGNVKIPINCGVVFPNINKFDYTKSGLGAVVSEDKIFFWDDLHESSDICSDKSGKCFQKTISKKFASQFRFSISQKEFHHLRQLIFPVVRIDLPERENEKGYASRLERLRVLDHNQEAIARKFDGGHRIIMGPSGSGKSLVLVHKAAFLKQYNPDIHNILFVCYNITLVNYIRRLLSGKKVPLGDVGVTVCHFYELCSEIIGEEVAYEKEDADYYDMVVQEAISKLEEYEKRYDAILVDEGQDFSRDMLKIVTALLNPKTNNLTIALDDNQNIYWGKGHWKDAGIQARGRVHKIPCVYRNTVEIAKFANRFIRQGKKEITEEKANKPELFPGFSDFHGPKPEINQFRNFEEITAYTANKTAEVVKTENCPYSEIAVLYAMKNPGKTLNTPLPQLVESGLEAKGILCNWISENFRSKRTYDITTNSVTISTIHSVKGLDYSFVFLLGLDFLEPRGWTEEQLIRLVYVAITRARYQLFIPYVRENNVIKRLRKFLKK